MTLLESQESDGPTRLTDIMTGGSVQGQGLSTNTISQYLNALRRLYILDDQEPWADGVRSTVAQRTAPVRRYCDPSLAAALLRLTPDKLMSAFSTFGLLFESLCIRDLRVYAQANDANVWHYRDLSGPECDAIVECSDGSLGAVEIKLETTREDEAAATLLRLQRTIHSQHVGEVAFLLILTAGGHAYRRADGVHAVPITCLAP
jgi:predicted AAA+ superfamily ATPase